jgi:FlaA1/EpsC-like NDP-sugar epimerase
MRNAHALAQSERMATLEKAATRDGGQEMRPELQATLLVGAGDGARLLAHELRQNPNWGFHPVGFVDDHPAKLGSRIAGLPVLGTTYDIPGVVQRKHIDVVIVAIPSATDVTLARITDVARRSSARVLTMPSIGAILRGEASPTLLRKLKIEEILGRPEVWADIDRCRDFVAGRRILITGAAGSIGTELTRQVAELTPAQIIALDNNETGLHDIKQELLLRSARIDVATVVASVTNARRLGAVFAHYRPEVVFHAAAYKHVSLMEDHPEEAAMVNVVGTYRVAMAAAAEGVARFVLVSTDKAVNPTSIMGATKRIAELVVEAVANQTGLSACCVRFGNVIGSRGSVIPTFEKQIEAGGPVTVTHPAMKRFFMTIPEAASLIIQAGAFGDRRAIYELEMGDEVSIVELAKQMIRLHGLRVGQDIQIVFTGRRQGEKLREELTHDHELTEPTPHPKIRRLVQPVMGLTDVFAIDRAIARLVGVVDGADEARLREHIFAIASAANGIIAEKLVAAGD